MKKLVLGLSAMAVGLLVCVIVQSFEIGRFRAENEKLKHSVALGEKVAEGASRFVEAITTFNSADLSAQSIVKEGDWFFFLNYDDEAMLHRIEPDFVKSGRTNEYKVEPFAMVQVECYEGTNIVKKWEKDPSGISVWTRKNYHKQKGYAPGEL